MKKVLFVNPPSPDMTEIYIRDINRSGRKSKERIIWPQVSLAWLATQVDKDHDVKIVDCIAENMDWPAFETYLNKENPDYIVANVISSIITNDVKTFKLAKKIGAITIASGPHVTDRPEESLDKYDFLDYAIIGEAEVTLKHLIKTIGLGLSKRVPSLWYFSTISSFHLANSVSEALSGTCVCPLTLSTLYVLIRVLLSDVSH